jgi:tripartite-type tricarboxylate transporter receptor subunit TctC
MHGTRMTKTTKSISAVLCSLWLVSTASAQDAQDFYKGKTLTAIVGMAAGIDYDVWTRLIGRYMRKHLPGNPNFIAQNMPGSGSIIAANHLYNIARRDGTIIGMVSRNVPYSAVQGLPSVRYDALRFNWIGNADSGNRVCFARTDSRIEKPEDLFEHELIVAGTGVGSGVSATPALLKNLIGMKFKSVEGYTGVDDAALAMERGEVQAICETWSAFNKRRPAWIKSGFARPLFNMELEPMNGGEFPTIYKFLRTAEQRDIIAFYASSIYVGRPLVAPPDVPPERVELLRRAFDTTVADPEFVQETKYIGLDLNPSSGKQVEAIVRAVMGTSPELVKKTEALITRR